MSFVEIGARHNSDKGWFHQYYEVYDTLLARHRPTASAVLELGVKDGESLKVWAEAFPLGHIVGIDIDPVPDLDLPAWRTTVLQGDAYTFQRVRGLPLTFDVIIDDGPHTLESMCFVAEHYTQLLASNGTLVIEDIADPEWVGVIADCLPAHLRRHAFAIDRRHAPRPDGGGPVDVASILFVVDCAS